jgi:glycosyltransferase involved in cell wall biosynthesis
MRIGIDCRFWDESGVGRYIRNLVSELQKIDKKNSYVLFVSRKNQIEIKTPKWKIVRTDIHWHSLEEQIKFPQLINRENLNLMHFPYFSLPIFYHKPFIVTIHDLILHHFATGEATSRSQLVYKLKLLGYKFVMKKSAENAKKIITVSKATKEEIIKHLHVPEEKISVIYEGVEQKKTLNFQHSTLNYKNYLLHVGNLYPHKNMNLVLQSLKKIRDEDNLPVQLVIVGKEDYFYQKFQKKVKDLGLQDQIIFMGEVSDTKLQQLYEHALALISPSLMEGFDLPTIEAMKNNCLILASDIPVHREICKEIAIYFDPKSAEDLTSKIKEVYKNKKEMYKEKIESGSSRASQFNWEQMARETLKLYENSISL